MATHAIYHGCVSGLMKMEHLIRNSRPNVEFESEVMYLEQLLKIENKF